MKFRSILRAPAGAICALAIACTERTQVTTSPDTNVTPQTPALSVLVDAMLPGRAATVRGVFHRSAGMSAIGSFGLRVSYDTTRLTFDHDATTGQGMRLMNARDGVLTIAGAGTEGFGGDTLFAATFHVTGSAAAESISVDIVEIHGVNFQDLVPSLDARGGIRATRTSGIGR